MLKRDIVFRGKRVDNGQWVEGSLIGEDVIVGKIVDFEEDYFTTEFWYRVDPETIGLYTGLNAKKKKTNLSEKIFEGDIFRGLNDKDIEEYYVVMWIEQRAAFYMVPADHYCVLKDNDLSNDDDFNWLFDDAMLYDFSSDCSLTKVGNIHDNKDLLK